MTVFYHSQMLCIVEFKRKSSAKPPYLCSFSKLTKSVLNLEILLKYLLFYRRIVMLRDNGRNMVAAAKLLSTTYKLNVNDLDCAAHVMHNVIMKDFVSKLAAQVKLHPDLSARGITVGNALSKVRKIHGKLAYRLSGITEKTKEFKTLTGLSKMIGENFDEAIEYLRDSSVTLKTENSTRWNSLYAMLDTYLENSVSIRIQIEMEKQSAMQLSIEEEAIIRDLVAILDNFKEVSALLQGDTYETLYLVTLCDQMLKSSLTAGNLRHVHRHNYADAGNRPEPPH